MLENVYLNRDNTIDLLLKADGRVVDLEPVSRMVLKVGDKTIDSDDHPEVFDWDTGTTGKVILALGDIEGLTVGDIDTATLVIYDPSNPDGVVWGTFKIHVLED